MCGLADLEWTCAHLSVSLRASSGFSWALKTFSRYMAQPLNTVYEISTDAYQRLPAVEKKIFERELADWVCIDVVFRLPTDIEFMIERSRESHSIR